jgi:hypothetical protein
MAMTPPVSSIPFLDPSLFGGAIGRASDGLLSVCFEGYLLLPEGRRRAYFKTDPAGYAMLNEEIGYMLARCAKLPQPKAGKMWVRGKVLHQIDPVRWPDPTKPALCWVTHEAKDEKTKPALSVKAKLRVGPSTSPAMAIILRNTFLKFKLLGRLIVFDFWIANIDRNVGNVMLISADSFMLIDHGAILGGSTWPLSVHSKPGHYVATKILDSIFHPADATLSLPAKNAIVKESEALDQAYESASSWLAQVLDPAHGAAYSYAHNFLKHRILATTGLLRKKIGLVT